MRGEIIKDAILNILSLSLVVHGADLLLSLGILDEWTERISLHHRLELVRLECDEWMLLLCTIVQEEDSANQDWKEIEKQRWCHRQHWLQRKKTRWKKEKGESLTVLMNTFDEQNEAFGSRKNVMFQLGKAFLSRDDHALQTFLFGVSCAFTREKQLEKESLVVHTEKIKRKRTVK
jgi:hypothetical protein